MTCTHISHYRNILYLPTHSVCSLIAGFRNDSAKIAQPEVIHVRTPEATGQQSSGAASNAVAPIDRIANGLSNINHVNKGSVQISQGGLYGYTDLPPKEFGHVSGELWWSMNL